MGRDLNAILREDAKRRNARQAQEDAWIEAISKTVDDEAPRDYICDARTIRKIGVVNPPRHANRPRKQPKGWSGRTVGVAPDSKSTTPSMRVTLADGTSYVTEIKRARSYKPTTGARQTSGNSLAQSDCARMNVGNIGNVE